MLVEVRVKYAYEIIEATAKNQGIEITHFDKIRMHTRMLLAAEEAVINSLEASFKELEATQR